MISRARPGFFAAGWGGRFEARKFEIMALGSRIRSVENRTPGGRFEARDREV
jgi:hypothetical protein